MSLQAEEGRRLASTRAEGAQAPVGVGPSCNNNPETVPGELPGTQPDMESNRCNTQ